MTREDIIRMAREADSYASKTHTQWVGPEMQNEEWIICRDERFAALVAAAERDKWMERAAILIRGEREACAKVCEDFSRIYGGLFANAIRARAIGNRAYDRYEGEQP